MLLGTARGCRSASLRAPFRKAGDRPRVSARWVWLARGEPSRHRCRRQGQLSAAWFSPIANSFYTLRRESGGIINFSRGEWARGFWEALAGEAGAKAGEAL